MRTINQFLNLAGFKDASDYLGTFSSFVKPIALASFSIAGIVGFIETYSGISFLLWVFLVVGSFFDLFLGWYTNVFFLKQDFETSKFFRGIMKSFVTVSFIFLTNLLKIGILDSEVSIEWYKATIIFIASVIHYTSVFLIGMYLLLGVAENLAKLDVAPAKSFVKILKMRINYVEEIGSNKKI